MDSEQSELLGKVKQALLSMQRYSWEQGVAAQAFLESGDMDLVVLFAKGAVARQLADGRLAVMGNLTAVTDPAAIGEALLAAAKATGDASMKEAADGMLAWLLHAAPRTKGGVLYHLHDRPQRFSSSWKQRQRARAGDLGMAEGGTRALTRSPAPLPWRCAPSPTAAGACSTAWKCLS